jgi:hypothetical protein
VRAEIGLDPRRGEANELRPQAVGGRPGGSRLGIRQNGATVR